MSCTVSLQQKFTSPFRKVDGHELGLMVKYMRDLGIDGPGHAGSVWSPEDTPHASDKWKKTARAKFHAKVGVDLAQSCLLNVHVVAKLWNVFQFLIKINYDPPGLLSRSSLHLLPTFEFNRPLAARVYQLFDGNTVDETRWKKPHGMNFENFVLMHAVSVEPAQVALDLHKLRWTCTRSQRPILSPRIV